MPSRSETKTITKGRSIEEPPAEPVGQGKKPEKGPFRLQVDRQTKEFYATYEAAEAAGLVIKKRYPVVQVTIYDARSGVRKIIELPQK